MTDADRKYSEEEFALILRRASQIQDRPDVGGTGEGMSLEEIRAIAREVGIDAAAVDRAAALLPRGVSRDAFARILGGPIRYRLASTAQRSLSETDLVRLVDAVRGAAEHHGKVDYAPRGFEWHTVGEVSQIHVTALPLEDGVQLRVTADRGAAALLTLFLSITGWLVVAGITGATIAPESAAVGTAIVSVGLLAGCAQSRLLWKRTTRGIREKLQRIMTALTDATATRATQETTEPAEIVETVETPSEESR